MEKENERRRREALVGSGGMLLQKMFDFRASEMQFPMFFGGSLCIYGTLVQLILVTMWIQANGETCNVNGYAMRFKSL